MFYNGVRLGDILAFGFGLNDAGGNHSAGNPVKVIVRRAGDTAGAAAIASTDATHLTHANVPVGLYEYVFSVSADTYSVTAGENYLVYAYASASGLSTVACVGGFRIAAPAVNLVRIDNASATAALSAIVYIAATTAARDIGVTSANAVSVAAKQALIDYDVPTSADVSAIVSVVAFIAATSAIRGVGLLSAQAASAIAAGALADYDVPTSADVSALVSTVGMIANLSALRAVGVLSAQAASVVVAQALADYDVPTSADVSAIVNASWKITTLAEPTDVPAWASATPANLLAWMGMLASNRMVQTSVATKIQNAAGVEIASASVAYDGTTFTRGPWVG